MSEPKTRESFPPGSIDTVEELLAHAFALEREMVERYEEIADAMEVHNNPEVAELFRKLAGYGDKHVAQIKARAEGMNIPHLSPWDYKWCEGESPEAASLDGTHYLMTPYHAILLALKAEVRAHDFYAGVAAAVADPAVKELAGEFADEEAGHVSLLEDWSARYPKPEEHWDYDPDPPGMPE